jgi:hypothetical protein
VGFELVPDCEVEGEEGGSGRGRGGGGGGRGKEEEEEERRRKMICILDGSNERKERHAPEMEPFALLCFLLSDTCSTLERDRTP